MRAQREERKERGEGDESIGREKDDFRSWQCELWINFLCRSGLPWPGSRRLGSECDSHGPIVGWGCHCFSHTAGETHVQSLACRLPKARVRGSEWEWQREAAASLQYRSQLLPGGFPTQAWSGNWDTVTGGTALSLEISLRPTPTSVNSLFIKFSSSRAICVLLGPT